MSKERRGSSPRRKDLGVVGVDLGSVPFSPLRDAFSLHLQRAHTVIRFIGRQ